MGVVVRRTGRLGQGWVRLVLLGCRQGGSRIGGWRRAGGMVGRESALSLAGLGIGNTLDLLGATSMVGADERGPIDG
jgi:hypothetical protein